MWLQPEKRNWHNQWMYQQLLQPLPLLLLALLDVGLPPIVLVTSLPPLLHRYEMRRKEMRQQEQLSMVMQMAITGMMAYLGTKKPRDHDDDNRPTV
jgi:hypothetical protein